jgi:predicted dehydrogenase
MLENPKRRDFLKSAAVTGVALTVQSGRILGANDRINVAAIGLGNRGSYISDQFAGIGSKTNACQVVAVCDLYQKRLRTTKERLKCDGTPDYREIVNRKDVDAIIVATPDHWHAPLAIAAMRAGKDVYLEKPMCHTIEEARQLTQVVKETRRIVQVGSQTCSSDQWYKTRDAIADGAIGKMVLSQGSYCGNQAIWNWPLDADASPQGKGDNYVDWNTFLGSAPKRAWDPDRFFRFRKYWDYSGGIATDLFFHCAAPLNICWGEPQFPYQVMASGGQFIHKDAEVPDTYHLMAVYPKGHSLVLISTQNNSTHIPASILGDLGTITVMDNGRFEGITDHITLRPETRKIQTDDKYKAYREKFGTAEKVIPVGMQPNVPAHIQNFLDCVRSRSKPNLDVETAARPQVLVTMSVQSYREARPLYFDEKTWSVSPKPPKSAS